MIEVIEFFDESGEEIIHRIPEGGSGEFKMGAQLIVRENQSAVFFRDGKALDVIGPGRHTLSTQNIPILTKLLSLPFGFNVPFKAEVLFVNKKAFTNMKWGTVQPIPFRDAELNMVNLRAFGLFSFRVTDELLFVNTIVGTQGIYTSPVLENFLRGIIVGRLNDILGENLKTVFDLPAQYDEIGATMKVRVKDDLAKYGLETLDMVVNAITPPDEVMARIDERAGMAAIGNMQAYMQFKAAQAMTKAAEAGGGAGGVGGTAAAGMGLGVGAGMGMMIPSMLAQSMQQAGQQVMVCSQCKGTMPVGSKFCPHCGLKLGTDVKCPHCGEDIPAGSAFCPKCGQKIEGGGEAK